MWIPQVAALLLTISTLQASTQANTCPDVQQKLQALLEAVQALCGSSTPSTTTTQPAPVVQQCDCSPEVTWTSVTMTSIGSSNLQQTGTIAYDIPSVIPSSAKEVLVLADVKLMEVDLQTIDTMLRSIQRRTRGSMRNNYNCVALLPPKCLVY